MEIVPGRSTKLVRHFILLTVLFRHLKIDYQEQNWPAPIFIKPDLSAGNLASPKLSFQRSS
jgi:hypothetical protein